MIMREIALFLLGMMLLAVMGCTGPSVPQSGANITIQENLTANPGATPPGPGNVIEAPATPFAARDGVANATAAAVKLVQDSKLVSIYGDCAQDGTAGQWQYYFNSVAAMTGYAVTVPDPELNARNVQYQARRLLPAQWQDSAVATKACGHGGQCTLEMESGVPVWTVIAGQDVCKVDAATGAVMG